MNSQYDSLAQFQGQQGTPRVVTPSTAEQIAALHDRLVQKNSDYRALVLLVDARTEAVLALLEKDGTTFEHYQSLTGELRGLRAARGASTVKRGQK